MNEVRIEDWSLAELPDDPFCPPECKVKVLVGRVYGHPHKADGERIRTTAIVPSKSRGTLVVTESGRRYHLGAVEAGYREWLQREGFVFDPEEPIAFNKRARRKA